MSRPLTSSQSWESCVGQAVARAREAEGITQEGLAKSVRDLFGLSWTRSTVAAIETKERGLSLMEAAALCHVLPGQFPKGASDLFGANAGEWLRVSPIGEVTVSRTRAALAGVPQQNLGDVRSEARFRLGDRVGEDFVTLLQAINAREALPPLFDEAERKAAASLNVAVEVISAMARHLWGRSLGEERDRRLDNDSRSGTRALATRKGHITRQLLAEIRHELEGIGESQ